MMLHLLSLALLLVVLASPNAVGLENSAMMLDGSIGVLYERGDLDDASKKSDRYDEIGFIIVPFAEIRTPLPVVSSRTPSP